MTGPRKPTRQERRAAERRKGKTVLPMVRIHDLTPSEAELLAECCDAYRLQQERDLPAEQATWTVAQAWAYARAAQFRDMLQAAVEGRPVPFDSSGERLEPGA